MAKKNRPKKFGATEAVHRVGGSAYRDARWLLNTGKTGHATVFEVLDEAIAIGLQTMRMQVHVADSSMADTHVVVPEAVIAALVAQSSACIELREGTKRHPGHANEWLSRWAIATVQVAACVLGYSKTEGVVQQLRARGSEVALPSVDPARLLANHFMRVVSLDGQETYRWRSKSVQEASQDVSTLCGDGPAILDGPTTSACACGDPIPGLGVGEVFFCHTCGALWTRTASLGVVRLQTQTDGAG